MDYHVLQIIVSIYSSIDTAVCPYCGIKSSSVHSKYYREIQDLPVQNKQLLLLVLTRRFFCNNKGCSTRTFSEQHSFVCEKGKKTGRLKEFILKQSLELSSVNCLRLLKLNGVNASKSSICDMIKKTPIIEKKTVAYVLMILH